MGENSKKNGVFKEDKMGSFCCLVSLERVRERERKGGRCEEVEWYKYAKEEKEKVRDRMNEMLS